MEEINVEEAVMRSFVSPRWTGAQSIALVHQLNEQCVECLCEIALTPSSHALPPFLLHHREHWCRLDGQARRRMAALPFVIVDLCFQDAAWWQCAPEGRASHSADRTASVGTSLRFSEDLVLETILFARQAVREDRHVAQMLFGMTAGVAEQIAVLSMQRAMAIAGSAGHCLTVRWAEDLESWQDWLIAARSADEEALIALRHHAKLLFCGGFIRSASTP